MRVLLVYPRYPDTFWSFRHALKFISKKAAFPPLGLLTVASMLPRDWECTLVDLNVEPLHDAQIIRADLVFISAMSIQTESVREIIRRCTALGRRIVAGGPLFTSGDERFDTVDHFVLNEAELTLPAFIRDLEEGHPRRIYTSDRWADLAETPLPRWELADLSKYSSMNIQYSRGCPYDCEFCDITVLYGRRPRTKSKEQVLAELDHILSAGWKGPVFFVDDNFIGNRRKLKRDILPAITAWMTAHDSPFWFNTEASINLADDDELLRLMVQAGFETVFIGIESPHEESLSGCNKVQNRNRDLIASVRKIQKAGIEVQAGFIVGFDQDPLTIFDRLIEFIQQSGIVTAMVGLLNAPKGTKLYNRLLSEGRLLGVFTGDNMNFSINFKPAMELETLIAGYRKILHSIYAPRQFYARIFDLLRNYGQTNKRVAHFSFRYLQAFVRSVIMLGIVGRERWYFWKLIFWTLVRKPRLLSLAVLSTIYGFHFRKISGIQ
jgi:radical SAM superfamily enzyme YgiQ (UPF0313 family)